MSNGNGSSFFSGDGSDLSGMFGDVTSGSSSSDFVGGGGDTAYGMGAGDTYGSDTSGATANYGSLLGGFNPSTLGNTGAGTLVGTSSRGHKKYVTSSGITYSGRAHMNPLNPRALRRAISRVYRFETFAKRVLKITSPHHHVAGIKRHRRRRRSW